MRGEQLPELFLSFAGVFGDRVYAFKGASRPKGFPYLTGREQAKMLLYRPRFRHPDRAAVPPNWPDAAAIGSGLNPMPANAGDLAVDVNTPSGRTVAVDDPALLRELEESLGKPEGLSLLRCDKSITDCRPISLFSIQTVRALGEELGLTLDKRRFRANIFADLAPRGGFAEDELVGRTLRLGDRAVIAVLQRDARCAMITIDPETSDRHAAILSRVVKAHGGNAGIYGAVLAEGVVRTGDPIEVIS